MIDHAPLKKISDCDAWAEPEGEPKEWVCVRFSFGEDVPRSLFRLTRAEAGRLLEGMRRAIEAIPPPAEP